MIDIFGADFAADPWPVLTRLRCAGDGVHRVRTPDGAAAWLVTRHADVRAALLDDRLATQPTRAAEGEYRGFALPPALDRHLLTVEPVDHTRLRSLATALLSPHHLASRLPRIEHHVRERVAALRRSETTVAVADRFALTVPAGIVGVLLGLVNEEVDAVTDWARRTLHPGPDAPPARDTLATMLRLIEQITTRHQKCGGTQPVCRLATASLGQDELSSMLFYLLFVWYEVVVGSILGALAVLADHPAHADTLRRNPDQLPAAVDELLRFLSPQMLAGPRIVRIQLRIGRTDLAPGATVLLGLGAANHDPTVFPDPDLFTPARASNPHLGLGHGTHACLGNAITRTALRTVVHEFLQHWPQIALAEPITGWRSGFRHRGPSEVVLAAPGRRPE